MTFKGTAKMNQRALEERFENMGGHLNAYTSREHTVYFARVFKSDVPEALNILADMLTAPKLDEGAIERERHVILREMEEVNQQTVRVVVVFSLSLSLSLSFFLSLFRTPCTAPRSAHQGLRCGPTFCTPAPSPFTPRAHAR
jgi:hypothetical protein